MGECPRTGEHGTGPTCSFFLFFWGGEAFDLRNWGTAWICFRNMFLYFSLFLQQIQANRKMIPFLMFRRCCSQCRRDCRRPDCRHFRLATPVRVFDQLGNSSPVAPCCIMLRPVLLLGRIPSTLHSCSRCMSCFFFFLRGLLMCTRYTAQAVYGTQRTWRNWSHLAFGTDP